MINKLITDNAFLSSQRHVGDVPADEFIARVFNEATQKKDLYNWLNELNSNTQLSLPSLFADEQLVKDTCQLPFWADSKLMAKGSAFFTRHATLIMNLLGLLSLPYCYAAADGAMVLYLSDKIRNDTGKRLYDTAEFVWTVMAPGAFEQNGRAFAAILKVRLMHAAARYYTLKYNTWDSAWGNPINQEDMAGTNLAFSLIVMRGLRKFGINISETDRRAFLHLWQVIGYKLGIKTELLPANGKEAYDLEQAIRSQQFKASEQGKTLTTSLTDFFSKLENITPLSHKETVQLMRYLLGDEVANLLDIPKGNLPDSTIRLMQITNTFKDLKPVDNLHHTYLDLYYQFKKTNLTGAK